LLRGRSDRVLDELRSIGKRVRDGIALWIISKVGTVERIPLSALLGEDKKRAMQRIDGRIVLLPPSAGGLSVQGMLDGTTPFAADRRARYCIADKWLDQGDPRRERKHSHERSVTPPSGMRWLRTIDLWPDADETGLPDDFGPRFWHWYT